MQQNPPPSALSGLAELSGSGWIVHFAIQYYPVSGNPAYVTIHTTLQFMVFLGIVALIWNTSKDIATYC